ncbi:MAG TPA: uroporphyrinogen-III synthase [Candidatus Binatia bacterium]|nr:uroporphyrinogen-III synthase [Candidatus Binatia bacterium]
MATTNQTRALSGRRIAVTRAPEQAGQLARLLAEHGAEVVLCPLVAFERPADSAALDAALRRLHEFDWLLFTSQNAVRFFEERRRELEVALEWSHPRVAAIGPATAKAAQELGYGVESVAEEATGEALAAGLRNVLAGRSVLLPRSDRARPDLPRALAADGARVTDVVAYRTIAAGPEGEAALEQIRNGGIQVVTLASPSAFERLADQLGAATLAALTASGALALAAIGPVTAAAIRQAGLPVAIVPSKPGAGDLVQALSAHFAGVPSRSETPARPTVTGVKEP